MLDCVACIGECAENKSCQTKKKKPIVNVFIIVGAEKIIKTFVKYLKLWVWI